MRERTWSIHGVHMKISQDELICSRVQIVSSPLLLAMVRGHCGSKMVLRKSY